MVFRTKTQNNEHISLPSCSPENIFDFYQFINLNLYFCLFKSKIRERNPRTCNNIQCNTTVTHETHLGKIPIDNVIVGPPTYWNINKTHPLHNEFCNLLSVFTDQPAWTIGHGQPNE